MARNYFHQKVEDAKGGPFKNGSPRQFQGLNDKNMLYTLNRNRMISPSCTTYSLPSERSRPFSRTLAIEPLAFISSKATTSARMKPRSKSVWILPAAWGRECPG